MTGEGQWLNCHDFVSLLFHLMYGLLQTLDDDRAHLF